MSFNKAYQSAVQNILDNGSWLETRGTKSLYVFNQTIQHDLRNSFPILSLRNCYPKGSIQEAQQDLNPNGFNINNLQSKGLRKAWQPFANEWGIVPNTYNRSLRQWPGSSSLPFTNRLLGNQSHKPVDQFSKALKMLRTDPTNRSNVIQIHNPNSTNSQTTCQTSVVLSSDGKHLDLQVMARSSDIMFGFVGDFIRYSTFVHLLAYLSGLSARYIAFTATNQHIYQSDISDAIAIFASSYNEPTKPQFDITSADDDFNFTYKLTDYQPDKSFKLSSKTITVGDLSSYGL